MAQLSHEMQAYISATQHCLEQCEVMLGQEREKRQALLNSEEKRLEQMIQMQQASYMQLESLEQRRLAAQEAAGFEGKTAREILESIQDKELKGQLTSLFTRLRTTMEELKEQNKTAMEIATTSLRLMERISPQVRQTPARATYSPKTTAGSSWTPGTSFEKKV